MSKKDWNNLGVSGRLCIRKLVWILGIVSLIIVCVYGVKLSSANSSSSDSQSNKRSTTSSKKPLQTGGSSRGDRHSFPSNSTLIEVPPDLAVHVKEIAENAKRELILLTKRSEESGSISSQELDVIRNKIADAKTPAEQIQLQSELARAFGEVANEKSSRHQAKMEDSNYRKLICLSLLPRFLVPAGESTKLVGEAGMRARKMEQLLATFCKEYESMSQGEFDQQWSEMDQLEHELSRDRKLQPFKTYLRR